MTVSSLMRAHDVRALLELTALVQLTEALDDLIVRNEMRPGDAVAEHCAESFRRRREGVAAQRDALIASLALRGGEIDAVSER